MQNRISLSPANGTANRSIIGDKPSELTANIKASLTKQPALYVAAGIFLGVTLGWLFKRQLNGRGLNPQTSAAVETSRQMPTVETKPTRSGSKRSVAFNAAGVLGGVTELLELQAHLFAADLRVSSRRIAAALILLTLAVCVLVGTVPVALQALGQFFREEYGMSHAVALLSSAGVGAALGVVFFLCGWNCLRRSLRTLANSREELTQNYQSIKRILKRT